MLTRLLPVVLAACVLGACGFDEPEEGAVAGAVAEQLHYLPADSAAVVAVDLRWDGDNWDDLRPIAEVFDDLVATISADPDATVASARLDLRD